MKRWVYIALAFLLYFGVIPAVMHYNHIDLLPAIGIIVCFYVGHLLERRAWRERN